jgi:hypothetical protein
LNIMAKPDPTPQDELRNNATALRQVTTALEEATAQRTDAIAAGDLEIVKRLDKRLADLRSELAFRKERRVLLAQQAAEADLAARTQARDVAINSTVAPALVMVIDHIQQFEAKLTEAAAAYAAIKQAFADHTRAWPAAVPPAPAWQEFTLSGMSALMKLALTNTARMGDFEHVMRRFGEELPSVALRRQANAYLADLKAASLPAARVSAA